MSCTCENLLLTLQSKLCKNFFDDDAIYYNQSLQTNCILLLINITTCNFIISWKYNIYFIMLLYLWDITKNMSEKRDLLYYVLFRYCCKNVNLNGLRKPKKIYETFPKINWQTCIECVCVKRKSTIKIPYITNINNSIS